MKRAIIGIFVIVFILSSMSTVSAQSSTFLLSGVVTDGNSVYDGPYTIKIISKDAYNTFQQEVVWFERSYSGTGRFTFDVQLSDESCHEAYIVTEIIQPGSTTRQQLTFPEVYMCGGGTSDVALITVDIATVREIRGVVPVYPYDRLTLADALYILRVLTGGDLPTPPGG